MLHSPVSPRGTLAKRVSCDNNGQWGLSIYIKRVFFFLSQSVKLIFVLGGVYSSMNFNTYIDLCNHYHNKDTNPHHHPFVGTPPSPIPSCPLPFHCQLPTPTATNLFPVQIPVNKYLFIWIHWILVAACGIFDCHCSLQIFFPFFFLVAVYGIFSCSMWDLVPTRDQTQAPCFGSVES